MRFRIRHVTRFSYDRPAYESHNEVRLKPRSGPGQRTLGFRLETRPHAAVMEYPDAFGNLVHALSVHQPHRELLLIADVLVDRSTAPILDHQRQPFEQYLSHDEMRSQEQYDFLHQSRYVPLGDSLKKLFWMVRPGKQELVGDYAARIVAWVRDQFDYEPGATHVHSDVNEVLKLGAGVCQDFAHLTLGILRLAGIPARYVSGYLAPKRDGASSVPLGPQASHAWIEVLLPEAGWTGFDPTHGCRTNEHHIRIAVGRDYGDVPPVRGVYRSAGSKQSMSVVLDIDQTTDTDTGDPFDPGAMQQ